uniref:Nedd4 family interacting protein 2 n=1 Tax=Taeniopygia guttata TaxID=59729 RepID=A0A674G8E4_TAEGU
MSSALYCTSSRPVVINSDKYLGKAWAWAVTALQNTAAERSAGKVGEAPLSAAAAGAAAGAGAHARPGRSERGCRRGGARALRRRGGGRGAAAAGQGRAGRRRRRASGRGKKGRKKGREGRSGRRGAGSEELRPRPCVSAGGQDGSPPARQPLPSVAFIFNWIGFCLSFCITNTIAGRYGAICGFGLSLIKWILIVRFSDYFTGYFNGQYWLWWIFLVLGLLLFFRGFVNYLKVRNMSESMAAAHRTRFFFLY